MVFSYLERNRPWIKNKTDIHILMCYDYPPDRTDRCGMASVRDNERTHVGNRRKGSHHKS